MKLSKKKMTVLTFTLGACVFVSTAFADVLLGSGYDQLKSSAKTTASQMEDQLNNYTIEMLFTLKDNDRALMQMSTVNKIDRFYKSSENTATTKYNNGKTTTSYSYTDEKKNIRKGSIDNKYYVTEYPDDIKSEKGNSFHNPFKEKEAPEMEKIVDALVGNLKNYVQVEEKPDGGKVYSGSVTAMQVPAIVNAVSSFGIKQMIQDEGRSDNGLKMEEMESDIYVKKMSGTAIENKAGILENVTGDVILSGKDKKGVSHELTLSVVFKLADIGQTKITTPNLAGANVEKVSYFGGLTSKYVGTYKNNIVIEKNDQFIKIGERTIDITSVENGQVKGKYTETVEPGYEADYPEVYNFEFQYKQNESNPMFSYKNTKGQQEYGTIHPSNPGKIYLELKVKKINDNSYQYNDRPNFDQEFNRVFVK